MKRETLVDFTSIIEKRLECVVILPKALSDICEVFCYIPTLSKVFSSVTMFSKRSNISLFDKIDFGGEVCFRDSKKMKLNKKESLILDFSKRSKTNLKKAKRSLFIGENSNVKINGLAQTFEKIPKICGLLFGIKVKKSSLVELFDKIASQQDRAELPKKNKRVVVIDRAVSKQKVAKLIEKNSNGFNLFFTRVLIGFGRTNRQNIIKCKSLFDKFILCKSANKFITDDEDLYQFFKKIQIGHPIFLKRSQKLEKEIF